MSSERKEQKPSQAVAVCGESRTPGDNGGDGKTQFGCASRPYPLKSWQEIFLGFHDFFVRGASAMPEPVRSDG
jgi:hypothetical protein